MAVYYARYKSGKNKFRGMRRNDCNCDEIKIAKSMGEWKVLDK